MAKKDNVREVIAASELADTKKNVAYALTHLDGVTPELAIKLAQNGVTADSLKGMGLDRLTLHYGLSAQEADKVMKSAAKGLPEGVEAKLDFVTTPTNEEIDDGDEKKASKKGK